MMAILWSNTINAGTPVAHLLIGEQPQPFGTEPDVQGVRCSSGAPTGELAETGEPGSSHTAAAPGDHSEPVAETTYIDLPNCPRCGSGQVTRRGTYARKDGSRHPRFLCRDCMRSFCPTTGTPLAYMKKRETWAEHERAMATACSLRAMAQRLGIHLTTAFRWRHLHIERLRQAQVPDAPLGDSVAVAEVLIRYSEKGSRVTVGPGSHGSRWGQVFRGRGDWLGNGPKSRALARPGAPVFRWLIDGRPTRILVAHDGQRYGMAILGNQRMRPEVLRQGLEALVAPGSAVVPQMWGPFEAVCAELGLQLCKGSYPSGDDAMCDRRSAALWAASGVCRGVYVWFDQFKGVATRYLERYLAWYRAISDRRRASAPALVPAGQQ